MDKFIFDPFKRKLSLHHSPPNKFDIIEYTEQTENATIEAVRKGNKRYIKKTIFFNTQEADIMLILKKMLFFNPHFSLGVCKEGDKNTIFFENTGDIYLSEYLSSPYKKTHIIISCIIQVLIGLYMAYKEYSFTHYNLTVDNIKMVKCDKRDIFMYKIHEKVYTIPTYGYIAIIVNYDYSYIDGLICTPIIHKISEGKYKAYSLHKRDICTFLNSCQYHVKDYIDDDMFQIINKKLDIQDIVLILYKEFEEELIDSLKLFSTKFFDIAFILTRVCSEEREIHIDEAKKSLKLIITEFEKVQRYTRDVDTALKTFMLLVSIINRETSFMTIDKEKEKTISLMFLEKIENIMKYARPENINYQVLINSILTFSHYMCYRMYRFIESEVKKKEQILKRINSIHIIQSMVGSFKFKTVKNPNIYQWDYNNKSFKCT
jgi:hypothetical protein